jgi:hypothetical protein
MRYLDSNVFIIAALYTDELGEKARGLISAVEKDRVNAATSGNYIGLKFGARTAPTTSYLLWSNFKR